MATEHETAVRLALKTGDDLERIFDRILGSVAHPQGRILSAYRQARRALSGGELTLLQTLQVLADLRASIQDTIDVGLNQAIFVGAAQAMAEMQLYSIPEIAPRPSQMAERDAWLSVYVAQSKQVAALALNGDKTLIMGDGSRAGVLTPGPMLREGAKWLALAALTSYSSSIVNSLERGGSKNEFMRQLIAAIDEKTTDCCLRAHGQVVAMDEPFHLTGTPRYGNELMRPPFHDYCRSSQALVYKRDADDDLSQRMRLAARNELHARDRNGGNRQEIHPSHATSGRS